jgi:hypothetical protein
MAFELKVIGTCVETQPEYVTPCHGIPSRLRWASSCTLVTQVCQHTDRAAGHLTEYYQEACVD